MTNPYVVKFSLVLCALVMWSNCGWSLGEDANFYFTWGTQDRVLFSPHYQTIWYRLRSWAMEFKLDVHS